MSLRFSCTILYFLLLVTSCVKKRTSSHDSQAATTIEKKTHYLITRSGDSILTGVPLPVQANKTNSTVESNTITLNAPSKLSVLDNVGTLRVPKNVSLLQPTNKAILGEKGIAHPDTLKIITKTVPVIQQKPFPAGLPQMRENAIGNIQYIGEEEGISEYYNYCLIEDSRGYIWFGDRQGILNRYDGKYLTYFPIPEGFSDNNITLRALLEDRRGNLWVGTKTGIACFDGHRFTFYTNLEGNRSWEVSSILQDRNGDIWFGSLNRGVVRFDGSSFLHYTEKQGLSQNRIKSFLEDSEGRIWFGMGGKGICTFDSHAHRGGRDTITTYVGEGDLAYGEINTMLEDSGGNIWFGSESSGLYRFDGKQLSRYTTEEGLSGNTVQALLEDKKDRLWIGYYNFGVDIVDEYTIQHYSEQHGTNSVHANVFMEDSQGNIWAVTNEGLHRYGYQAFRHLNFEEEGNFLEPTQIVEDDQRFLWLSYNTGGDRNRGLIRFKSKSFVNFTSKEGLIGNLKQNRNMPLIKGIGNDLWLSTSNKIAMINGQDITNYFYPEQWEDIEIRSILESANGSLWLGTTSGLKLFDGNSFFSFSAQGDMAHGKIESLTIDNDGDLWLGGDNALGYFDRQNITYFTKNEGLPNNWIRTLLTAENGDLWIGTNGGVSRFDGVQFVNYTTEDGLVDNRIRNLIEDHDGNIWVGTQQGLSVLTPKRTDDQNLLYEIFNYGKLDGLKQPDFIQNSVCLDRNRRIWWGRTKGITMLDLNDFELPAQAPMIHLSHLEIEQQYVDYQRLADSVYQNALPLGTRLAHAFDSVATFFNFPTSLSLPYDLNHLTFHFSGIDWAAPHKLLYSFRIKELDTDWSLPQTEPYVDYRNLPHGTFTLEAKAIGAAKKWSTPIAYTFTVQPPWWLSWWAFALYALLAVVALTGLFLYQRRRYQLQTNLQLQQERADRLREMDQFKSRFYTNITHEFRTPLTVIKGMSEQIGKEKIKDMIQRNTDRLLNLVNQLLDLSKLESNSLPIQWVQADIIPFLQYLTESCHSLAEKKKLNLAFFSKEDQLVMDFDEIRLQQILINLLSNAIKFTPEYGSVKVIAAKAVQDGEVYLQLTVQDTGHGIPVEQLPQIFDRFYQIDNSTTRSGEGSGIGLALVRELVQLLQGRIEVASEEGRGSSFVLYLPIHQEATRKENLIPAPVSIAATTGGELVETTTETPPAADAEQPQVLVIEDNADVTEYILSCLQPTYALQTARNGREGVEKALESVPDVILCDVMMPEMDGFEVCHHLKRDRRTSHIPIVLLTAKATQEDKITGLKEGADAYLTKPFDQEELLVRLRNLATKSLRLRERLAEPDMLHNQPTEPEQKEAAFLQEVMDAIESNLDNELFNTHYLCRAMAMSRAQLYRKIKALTGYSTAEYIRTIRLNKAKQLLETTDLPIGEVAVLVGYKDFSHFSRSFAKAFGCTPSDVRG